MIATESPIELKIKDFNSWQKSRFGYIRYKTRGSNKNDFFVDIYREDGLFIRTKIRYVKEHVISEFIDEIYNIYKEVRNGR